MDLSSKTILSIDDDPYIQKHMEKILSNAGVKVIIADSVDDGLKKASEAPPHLIFTDLRMPNKTGFDLLKVRREIPFLKDVPVIVLSSEGSREIINKAFGLGANDYLKKPLEAKLVIQKLRKNLREQDFLVYEFKDEEDAIYLGFKLKGDCTKISAEDILVESSVKLPNDFEFRVKNSFLDEFAAEGVSIRSCSDSVMSTQEGHYLTTCEIIGLPSKIKYEIRKRVLGWK